MFSRCECVSGIIDGSNGNKFDSNGSKQSLAEAKGTCGDIFRFPGGARESSKSTAASHSNQVSKLGNIEEYFGELHESVLHSGISTC